MGGDHPIKERPRFHPVKEARGALSAGDQERVEPIWRIEHDVYARETRVVTHQLSRSSIPDRWSSWRTEDVRVGVKPLAPGEAWVESDVETEIAWPEVTARTNARLKLTSDPTTYYFDLVLDVFENDNLISTRHWETVTPRKLQ